jgi:K+-sensing histidine kinase KdpD
MPGLMPIKLKSFCTICSQTRLSFRHHTHVRLDISYSSQIINLKIIDEGHGVPADKLEEIFEIYHEENPIKGNHLKGTGIGLALAKGLALSHHGKLWAALNESGGMTFTLQLKPGTNILNKRK